MSDQTEYGTAHRGHRTSKTEFFVYFALIFLVAIPFAVLAWIGSVLRHGRLPATGPIGRAWSEAQRITPMIFLV